MFDKEWYRLAHPHIVREKIDPLTHFLLHGREHRLSPSRAFDAGRYLDQHEAARTSGLNPLVHYLKHGRRQRLEVHPAPPSGADRILDSGLFDAQWYLERYPDVAAARYPPLLHYLAHGWKEGRSPGPGFDTDWYLRRYPDILGTNPLLHFIDHGREEGLTPVKPARALEVAKATLASVEDLDPDLYSTEYFADPDRIDVVNGVPRHRVARAFEQIVGRIDCAPLAIVFVPWIIHGGADLVAGHAVRALAEAHGARFVLVVVSDNDCEEALHLMPDGVPILSLPRIDPALSSEERVALVDLLIRVLRPTTVLNVNSQACWEAMKRHGSRLVHFARLYAMLFCPDYSPSGRPSGYSDLYLRHCLPFLTAIYFDNRTHIEELVRQFAIPDELCDRLVTLYQPAAQFALPQRSEREPGAPLRVLWAGRFAAQKNVDLLVRIAESAPQFEFHVWGRGDETHEARLAELARRCRNVLLNGPFERFEALPLTTYDAFLYTSLWDGIPNVLLEAAAAGLPIVAAHVGGIGELVDGDTGWLITAFDEPAPYVDALQSIADDPRRAREAVSAMTRRLQDHHNWRRYREVLAREPSESGGLLHGSANDNGSAERPSRGADRQTVP
ncbi:glycosyltransferase family 4 protein [Shinella sp. BYT-45]|uniref:glycosyltransferase family 4 protein n=1 Tax=Shinella sp. BYT-45 TaxID=3377377 RepID=UPI0039804001